MNGQIHATDFQPYTLPLVNQSNRRLENAIRDLIEEAKSEATWIETYSEAAQLLKSAPLEPMPSVVAQRHLANAREYCQTGEFGAACFELRQLRTLLAAL